MSPRLPIAPEDVPVNPTLPCPSCGSLESKVVRHRGGVKGLRARLQRKPSIYRRRECKACGWRYSTREHVDVADAVNDSQ